MMVRRFRPKARVALFLAAHGRKGQGPGEFGQLREFLLDLSVPDAAEHMRNAIAPYSWRVHAYFVGQDQNGVHREIPVVKG